MTNFWEQPDLLVRAGSKLYGCATPDSDDDQRGFVLEPAEYLLGRNDFQQHEDKINDVVIWGFKKFWFQIAQKGTPNTFEILYAPDSHIIEVSDLGRYVIENREKFVAKSHVIPIAGYARSEWLKAQLKTKNKETGDEYPSRRVVGAKRKDSHAKYGYSVKNAYHSIRLLQQGIELANTKHITFPRPEADMLRSIRNGELTFERLELEYERLDKQLNAVIEECDLEPRSDKRVLDEIYYDIVGPRIIGFLGSRNARTVS